MVVQLMSILLLAVIKETKMCSSSITNEIVSSQEKL